MEVCNANLNSRVVEVDVTIRSERPFFYTTQSGPKKVRAERVRNLRIQVQTSPPAFRATMESTISPDVSLILAAEGRLKQKVTKNE